MESGVWRDEFFTLMGLYRRIGDLFYYRYGEILMPSSVVETTREFIVRGNKPLIFIKENCLKLPDKEKDANLPPKYGSTIEELYENFTKMFDPYGKGHDKFMDENKFKEQLIYFGIYDPDWENCEDTDDSVRTNVMIVRDPVTKKHFNLPWAMYEDLLQVFLKKLQEGKSQGFQAKLKEQFEGGYAAKHILRWQKMTNVFLNG